MPTDSAATVNTPSADLMISFLDRVVASPYAQHVTLAPLLPLLARKRAELAALVGTYDGNPDFQKARVRARAADATLDEQHRLVAGLLEALDHHPDPVVRDAARALRTLLYPDGLAITQASFEVGAASGTSYAKRIGSEGARAAVATLSPELPKLAAHLAAVVTLAAALGDALTALEGVRVDDAGRPVNPALFDVRTEAQAALGRFLTVVDTFAYPGDDAAHRQAREALGGRYRRFLGAAHETREERAPSGDAPTPNP